MPDDYSVEAAAYAEQSGDTSSYEVIASENANYPKITGFSNTADGTKVSWSAYSGAAKYRLYVYRALQATDFTEEQQANRGACLQT